MTMFYNVCEVTSDGFWEKRIIFHIAFTMAANCPARLTLLYFSTLVIFCDRYKLWCHSACNCSFPSVIPPVLSTNILEYPLSDLLLLSKTTLHTHETIDEATEEKSRCSACKLGDRKHYLLLLSAAWQLLRLVLTVTKFTYSRIYQYHCVSM